MFSTYAGHCEESIGYDDEQFAFPQSEITSSLHPAHGGLYQGEDDAYMYNDDVDDLLYEIGKYHFVECDNAHVSNDSQAIRPLHLQIVVITDEPGKLLPKLLPIATSFLTNCMARQVRDMIPLTKPTTASTMTTVKLTMTPTRLKYTRAEVSPGLIFRQDRS